MEVSDTTLAADLSEKLPTYGRAGISEVWIVNLNDHTIEVYREPHLAGFTRKTIVSVGDQATALSFPDLTVTLAELFKR